MTAEAFADGTPLPPEPYMPEAPPTPPTTDPHRYGPTDTGNAERLVQAFGRDLHYVPTWKAWLTWSGRHWEADELGRVHQMAKATARSLYATASEAEDREARAKLVAHATRSESNRALGAMLDLAWHEPEIAVCTDDLDVDPWLLNAANGTIDLRTGELLPHRRDDRITKVIDATYSRTAECPTWLAFLDKIFAGDHALIAFVQRAVGYSLTGRIDEQVMFLPWGTGANGKTTFLETINALLGAYAETLKSEALTGTNVGNGPRDDIAALRGARFIAAAETGEGRRLDETLVKQLTGGDSISARFMYSKLFTFRPTGKIWMATNHRPVIKGSDHAIWRRILLIPFVVTIPDAEKDLDLPAKLRAELEGILAWAVRGCLAWQQVRLSPPPAVRQSTDDYRDEQDVFGQFITDHCVVDARATVSSAALFAAYTQWSAAQGEYRTLDQRLFGMRLRDLQYESCQINIAGSRVRGWRGIGLKARATSTSPVDPEAGRAQF